MNFKELGENLGLDEDEYRQLIDLFINTGAADFQRIQTALASSDLEQVLRSAHTIKGAAGNLGLMDISEVAKTIEESVSNHQMEGLTQAMETLRTQFDAVEAFAHG